MRKTELNNIITNKIDGLEESDEMKEYLYTILYIERKCGDYTKKEHVNELISLATRLSEKESGGE